MQKIAWLCLALIVLVETSCAATATGTDKPIVVEAKNKPSDKQWKQYDTRTVDYLIMKRLNDNVYPLIDYFDSK